MRLSTVFSKTLICLMLLLSYEHAAAEQVRVAVASNFAKAFVNIAEKFETDTGHTVTMITGSTGKHYAQIINGAPYDVFFAADAVRPELLEKEGQALPNSRFTYAFGKIILWSPKSDYVDLNASVLTQADFRFLAIANPKLAPYGKAAQQVLEAKGQWHELQSKLVRGENIAQTFQFVSTANAQLGFVSLSQVLQENQQIEGSFWHVPQSLYTPIEQQAILLKDNPTALAFINFAQSDEVKAIIRSYGYDTP